MILKKINLQMFLHSNVDLTKEEETQKTRNKILNEKRLDLLKDFEDYDSVFVRKLFYENRHSYIFDWHVYLKNVSDEDKAYLLSLSESFLNSPLIGTKDFIQYAKLPNKYIRMSDLRGMFRFLKHEDTLKELLEINIKYIFDIYNNIEILTKIANVDYTDILLEHFERALSSGKINTSKIDYYNHGTLKALFLRKQREKEEYISFADLLSPEDVPDSYYEDSNFTYEFFKKHLKSSRLINEKKYKSYILNLAEEQKYNLIIGCRWANEIFSKKDIDKETAKKIFKNCNLLEDSYSRPFVISKFLTKRQLRPLIRKYPQNIAYLDYDKFKDFLKEDVKNLSYLSSRQIKNYLNVFDTAQILYLFKNNDISDSDLTYLFKDKILPNLSPETMADFLLTGKDLPECFREYVINNFKEVRKFVLAKGDQI
jgi:hypothetical protein